MRRALLVFLLLIGILPSASCALFDEGAGKEEILSFVKENEDTLMECILCGDFSPVEHKRILRYAEIEDSEIDDGFVEFLCGGAGFGPETNYRGFYYAADDDMTRIWCAPSDRTARESGQGYLWKDIGDNWYYSEWICGHFYYYEAHF